MGGTNDTTIEVPSRNIYRWMNGTVGPDPTPAVGMIAHVVLFEPKAGTTVADRDAFLEVMRVTCNEIPSVKRSFIGIRQVLGVSYEERLGDKPYTYASVVEFDDMNGLHEYLNHPLHVKVGQLFWQHCERTMIVDVDCFWVNNKEVNN